MSFPESIDLVAYINIDTRGDRRQETERELSRIGVPQEKIMRWSATRMLNGALGCTTSHIALLEHIMTLPDTVQTVLILEDDFNFVDDVALVNESLRAFTCLPRDTWDIALLAYDVLQRADYNDLISIALVAKTTAGFLVNRACVPELLANFKEGREKLRVSRADALHSLDVYWWSFMQSRRCFYFNRSLGYQRRSYSNITGFVRQNNSVVRSTDRKRS